MDMPDVIPNFIIRIGHFGHNTRLIYAEIAILSERVQMDALKGQLRPNVKMDVVTTEHTRKPTGLSEVMKFKQSKVSLHILKIYCPIIFSNSS